MLFLWCGRSAVPQAGVCVAVWVAACCIITVQVFSGGLAPMLPPLLPLGTQELSVCACARARAAARAGWRNIVRAAVRGCPSCGVQYGGGCLEQYKARFARAAVYWERACWVRVLAGLVLCARVGKLIAVLCVRPRCVHTRHSRRVLACGRTACLGLKFGAGACGARCTCTCACARTPLCHHCVLWHPACPRVACQRAWTAPAGGCLYPL